MTVKISKKIYKQLVDWTLTERPNEAAGYLFKENTLFKKIVTGNHSVAHFIDENPEQLLRQIKKYRKPSAIFHSHPCQAVPSGTDLIYMQTTIPFFGCIWFIMSNKFKLRAWDLDENGSIIELGIEIIVMKSYKDRDWLFDQYITQEKSIREIAKECGVGSSTINRWLEKFNITKRSIAESLKGIKHSKEHKRKIGEAIKGKYLGKNHPQWKGDEIGYASLHEWLRRHKLKPKFCDMCGKPGKLELSNKTGKLIRDFDNFQYVHRDCHNKYDKENDIKHER